MNNITQTVTVNLNDELRKARPTSVFYCVVTPDRKIHIRVGKITDYGSSFNSISDEGYDPDGPNGPTYWRICNNYCCSTVTRDGEFYLIITELDPEAAANAYTTGACGEMAVSKAWDDLIPESAARALPYEIVCTDSAVKAAFELLVTGQVTGHSDPDG